MFGGKKFKDPKGTAATSSSAVVPAKRDAADLLKPFGKPAPKALKETEVNGLPADARTWTVQDVATWVHTFKAVLGAKTAEIAKGFEKNDIDGEILLTYVNPKELKEELGITSAGHCRKLIIAIDKLRGGEGQIATDYFHPSLSGAPAFGKSGSKTDRMAEVDEEEYGTTGADLFISYCHADRDMALKLKKGLEGQGLTCWMDTHLKTGDDWEMTLEENLTFSKAVVALVTPAYEVSESCRNEIRLSLNRGKRIFPVLAATLKQTPKVPLPDDHWPPHGFGFALARTQYNDFRTNWMLNSLLQDLEAYGVKKQGGEGFLSKWIPVKQSGDIPGVRFGSAFFNFGSHTVLYGGCTYVITQEKQDIIEHNDVFLLNNETMVWTKENPTGTPHPSGYGCSALLCGEGQMLCIGGGNYVKSYNDVTVLNFATMAWTTPTVKGEAPATRYGHTATLVNKKIYIFGGRQGEEYFNDVHVLDISDLPTSVTWSKVETTGIPPTPRYQSAAALIGGNLMVYGGSKIVVDDQIDPHVHFLDLHKFHWMVADVRGNVPSGRRQHSAVLVGHYVLFYGGKGKEKTLSDVVVLNTHTFEWNIDLKPEGTSPPDRGLHAAVQRGNQLLVFGGLTDIVTASYEVPSKGTQTQLLHLNDLCILELNAQ